MRYTYTTTIVSTSDNLAELLKQREVDLDAQKYLNEISSRHVVNVNVDTTDIIDDEAPAHTNLNNEEEK
jgi:hypothetical protein